MERSKSSNVSRFTSLFNRKSKRQTTEIQSENSFLWVIYSRMCSSKRMIYLINGWDNISGIENQATISKHSVWIMFCENFKIFLLYYQYFSLIRFMANISITFSRCETESNNKRIPSRVRLKIRSEAKGSYRKYNIDVYRVLVCQIVLLTFSLYIT